MLTPAAMKRVNLFVLEKDEHRLLRALGRLKLLHLESARPGSHLPLRPKAGRDKQLETCRRLQRRIDDLLASLEAAADGPEAQVAYLSPPEIGEKLNQIEAAVNEFGQQLEKLEGERSQLEALARDLEPFVGLGIPLEQFKDFSFLHFAIGAMPASSLEEMASAVGDSVVLIPGRRDQKRRHLVAITSKKGRFALQTELEKAGFKTEAVAPEQRGLADDTVASARARLEALLAERRTIESQRRQKAESLGPLLRAYRRTVNNEIRLAEAQANFAYSDSACLITGWVPAQQVNEFSEAVLVETSGCAALEVLDPAPDSEPPSKLQESPWLRPFSLLVSSYGFPRYREIEPTLFVALSFLGMFAFMFGDVGQGAVLALGGLVIRLKAAKQTTRDVGVILIACGLAAMVMGVVYGSYFGCKLFAPLWQEPLEDVMAILMFSLAVGSFMISLGLVVNIINRLRTRDFLHGIFDRAGLVGAVMYWAALWLAIQALVLKPEHLPLNQVIAIIAVGAVILFVREPLLVFLSRRKHGQAESVFEATVTAAIEVMDVFIIYLSNSLSFMRLAAYAVSHAALLLTTFQIAHMVRGVQGLGGPLAALVLVFGNVLIIALEGFIAGIQAIRLEYYEFFSKFFSGAGRAYQPFEAE